MQIIWKKDECIVQDNVAVFSGVTDSATKLELFEFITSFKKLPKYKTGVQFAPADKSFYFQDTTRILCGSSSDKDLSTSLTVYFYFSKLETSKEKINDFLEFLGSDSKV